MGVTMMTSVDFGHGDVIFQLSSMEPHGDRMIPCCIMGPAFSQTRWSSKDSEHLLGSAGTSMKFNVFTLSIKVSAGSYKLC
jgi:hypothetical protein